jgi:ribosomal protein L44E
MNFHQPSTFRPSSDAQETRRRSKEDADPNLAGSWARARQRRRETNQQTMTFSCTKCGSRTPTRGCDLCAESEDEQRDRERAEEHDFQSRREWDLIDDEQTHTQ